MTDEEFAKTCAELSRLADLVEAGEPEQIRKFAEYGWWDAMDVLRRVYNAWMLDDAA